MGSNPVGECKHFDRKLHPKVDVTRLKVIKEYVKFIISVDILDGMLAQHVLAKNKISPALKPPLQDVIPRQKKSRQYRQSLAFME